MIATALRPPPPARVKLAKNECAPPFTKAEFEIRYGTGVDTLSELIDLGLCAL